MPAVRLLVAGPGSAVGRYRLGKTGDALTPMAAPADLEPALSGTRIEVAWPPSLTHRPPIGRSSGA